ncbi:MAG TPA: phytoene/squalene synthase family protein [Candidatus Saccharimonadales bacterium]|nr:phytoene/squalene synthase family protein [Candidatus Saccharimonadales bacterium]
MQQPPDEAQIFRQASTTYYWSSRFFPKTVREDVFKLYSFVRTADDCVDSVPQQRAAFKALRRAWEQASADPHFDTTVAPDDTLNVRVIKNMVYVYKKHGFDYAWVTAFLDAMQADLDGKTYATLEDTLWYVHGSAEVIGLMMAKIMNLSPAAYEAAMLQGRAMQWINFIRDMHEDALLGRCYFPAEELVRFGLPDVSAETAATHKAPFKKFVHFQIAQYQAWQTAASAGMHHIPRRPRIALKTAVDMYNWTGRVIARRPHAVFDGKIKPSRYRVIGTGVKHVFRPNL